MARKNNSCVSFLQASRVRITRLDNCGRPVFGDNNMAVSSGIVNLTETANTVEDAEINQQNGEGEVCVFKPATTTLTGYSPAIQFCNVDYALFTLLTGMSPWEDENGNVYGMETDTKIPVKNHAVAVELWTNVSGDDESCDDPSAEGSWGYNLYPMVRGGYIDGVTYENGAITFTWTGGATREGNRWGQGPYHVELIDNGGGSAPSLLRRALSKSAQKLAIITNIAPPAGECGLRPLLDPATEPVTDVSVVGVGLEVDITVTPGDPDVYVWIEFGDGSWDYVPSNATIEHEYDEPGTYTIRVSSNGVWVEETVTVPVSS